MSASLDLKAAKLLKMSLKIVVRGIEWFLRAQAVDNFFLRAASILEITDGEQRALQKITDGEQRALRATS